MRRLAIVLMIIAVGVFGMTACKPGLLPTEDPGKPRVTLERVEIARLVPWVELPAPTLLGMGYLFNIENPSGYNVKLENFKFTIFFEGAPGQYLSVSLPTTYDTMYFPPKTVSQYRVVDILDSGAVWRSLIIANRPQMDALKLDPVATIKNWYAKVGDFGFGIRVGEGMAVFSSEKGDIFVPFEGKFPK